MEARLAREVQRRGGVCHKLAATQKGLPDRLVVLHGAVWFLEVKTATGRLSDAQRHRLHQLGAAGANTAVLYGAAGVDAWIATQDKDGTPWKTRNESF